MKFRIEKDSLGEIKVPEDATYGAQTQRAVNNFKISDLRLPSSFINTIVQIKKAAAFVNHELGILDEKIAQAIIQACDELLTGKYENQFPVDVFQTGSGTSTNMNVNEVLTTLASKHCDVTISANDHINMSQSSNDVIPTAIHVSTVLEIEGHLKPALNNLLNTLTQRSEELKNITKTGRTHLMDAMPITFGQEISGWAAQIKSGLDRINSVMPRLFKIAQGGTAVGSGINAHPDFAVNFARKLSQNLGITFTPNDNFFESLSSQDTAVELSGQLKTVAMSLIKIANDLRHMNSGPLSGIADIELVALQPGSSIMPGKVNPVIPEAVIMIGAQVIGNDTTVAFGGSFGNFQLNVMLPVIAYNLLQSINILSGGANTLAELAVRGFKVKTENAQSSLKLNPILVTALNPIIGYQKAAKIAKTAYSEGRPVIDVALEQTDLSREELTKLLDPIKLTKGGISN